ncbi:hypothetical protein E4U12_002009, partial [Claviceps purpurea]
MPKVASRKSSIEESDAVKYLSTSRSPSGPPLRSGAEGPRVASEEQLGGKCDICAVTVLAVESVQLQTYSGVGGPPSALRCAPGLGDSSGISPVASGIVQFQWNRPVPVESSSSSGIVQWWERGGTVT